MVVDLEKPGIGGEPLIGQKKVPKYSVYPKGEARDLPSWVAFDKQVKLTGLSSSVMNAKTYG